MKMVGDYPCKASAARTFLAFLLLFFVVPLSASPDDPILILPRMAPDNVRFAISADGTKLAVPGAMGSVLVFDVDTGEVVKTLSGLGHGWRDVAFTPDGQYLLGVSEISSQLRARVWRTSNWSLHAEVSASLPHWLRSVAIAPDARLLAVGGWNYLQVYDLTTGEKVTDLPQPGRYVYALKFSPDGQYLVSANGGTSAKVWQVSDWSEVATLAEGLSENVSLAFSPDGQYLALALSDGVKVWRTGAWDSSVQVLTHDALDAEVPVIFSQDSQLLAARAGARLVKIWNISDWTEHQTIDLGDLWYVNGIAIRGNTDLFTSIYGASFPWKVVHHAIATGAKVKDIRSPVEDEVNAVSFSPDGTRLALADYYHAAKVYRAVDWQKELDLPGSFWSVAFSPDGTRLFVSGSSGGVFSVPEGSRTWVMSASEGIFAPDEATIAIRKEADYSADYYYLYDASTGALIRSFDQQGTAIRHGLFTPDGKYLLAAARSGGWNYDDQFRVWRVSDGGLILSETWRALTASLDPTGNYLVIGSGGSLAIKSVVDTGDTLQFTDLRSWQAHGSDIYSVAFAPSGNVLVSGSEDAGVKIWRLQDGGLERTLLGHVEGVWSVATARSGDDLLVAAGGWGGLAVWRLPVPGTGNTPVSTPQLVYPDPNAQLDDWVLRFKATDPDSTNRLRFRVEVMAPDGTVVKRYDQTVDASPFDKPFAGSDEVVAVSLDPTLALGNYRWRVQATDGWSWSAWSEERAFTLAKPVLPLGELRTLQLNAGGTWRATLTVPEGAVKLFLSCRSFEQVLDHKVTLYYGGSKIHEQTGGDILIERTSPTAGEYEVEITPAATGPVAVYAGMELPRARLAGRYTGTIYHNDGYDWVQMDVPAGARALQFTVDAPGNVTTLEVWRGYIGSWERWSAQQSFNPPVRLTINNPQAGRYYLRIKDHGSLSQSQVRQYTLTVSGAKASLSASATPGTTSADSPDPVRFTLNYANEGDVPASSAVLKCVLPDGLTPVEGSITGNGAYDTDTRTVQWELGELGAGASGSVEFQAAVGSAIPDGTNLTVSATVESPDMEPVSQQAAVWVGAAGVTFDNVHTVYNYVNVTLRGLSIDRSQGAPRVWLEFPAGSATSFEVDAEEVTVSEDGTSVSARFALYDTVLQDVAPRLKLSHPSAGTREWQSPTLHVFDMGADLLYNKTFVRQGRRESFNLRVTNRNRVWETPFVKLQLGLENVPSSETVTVNYWVYSPAGNLVKNGSITSASGEAAILLPQLAPGATADYKVVVQVTGSRSQIRTRIEPMTIAIVTVVSGAAIIGSWAGHSILQSGCEKAIKRRLREDFFDAGYILDDAQINNIYNAYRQASSFASEWLAQAAAGATEQAIKDAVTAKYGEKFTKAAELAYKVGKGDHPVDILLGEIVSQLTPGLDWALLPATTAVKAFLAEGQNCIDTSNRLRNLVQRINRRNNNTRYRVTTAWDPNAKSGTFGVDGFIPDGQVIDYTIFFENLSTATAFTEEVLIEDVLDANLDDSTLKFTGFGFGSNEVTLPTPTSTLSQGVDLGNNLVVRVESSYDPSTRKLTVRFKGIDTRTGEHHEEGFLPPNNNEPEGEGYVTFRIQPRADTPSGTRIVNTATIIFDPHLGQNLPMTTNEHALTLDKQSPNVQVISLADVQVKPTFNIGWQGDDDASGLEYAEIWYSENGGAFRLWQTQVPGETRQQTGSATFTGKFGYTYRFYAVGRDRVGNRAANPSSAQATTTAGVAPNLAAGLQLIALPVDSEDADAKRVLNFDTDRLAAYDPASGYVRYPNATLQVGRGYWVQLPSAQRPAIRGNVPDEAQPFAIPLQRGWNLVGNPWLEDVAWNLNAISVELNGQTKSLAEAQSAGWVEDYAWGWDGAKYVLVYDSNIIPGVGSQMQAWRGCWLYAHQACNLVVPSPSATRSAAGRRTDGRQSGWSFPVRVQYGNDSAEVTIGFTSGGRGLSVGLPPQPPTASETAGVKLSILQGGQPLAVDVRRSAGKQTWELLAEWNGTDEANAPVVLTFGNVASVPRGTALWLVDTNTGKRHYLRTTATYRFAPAQGERSRQFQVVAEPETSGGLRITSVSAARTRGGAFNINFHLTRPAAVSAEVISASGKPVARLNPFGGRAVEGTQSLTWRGVDDSGIALPAGAYLLRLHATDEEGRQTQVNIPLVLTR